MKEFITIVLAFILVVALALYMYIGNKKSDISIIKYENVQEILIKDNEELKRELKELKKQVHITDSLYHKK
jgi:cell division protein YceG involved in septum cleavage